MNKKILFISHKKAKCGVYEFGKNISDILSHSKKYDFVRVECSSFSELEDAVSRNNPDAIIYNYMPSILPWVAEKKAPLLYKNNIATLKIPQIGIVHEVTQHVADGATAYRKKFIVSRGTDLINSIFDFYIAPDPTLLLKNNLVYKTGRLIQEYRNIFPFPATTTIGSFGFGTPKKGFEKIVQLVQENFDEAIIRFNIPAADFGDKNGIGARNIAERCKALINKPGIQLSITHDFLDNKGVLDFLAQNTINAFLYENTGSRGLSSAIDNALAVERPIAVSGSIMFRHVLDVSPSICVKKNNLRGIIENGFAPLQKHHNEWNAENLLWDYERILNSIFEKNQNQQRVGGGFTWLRNSEKANEDDMTVIDSVLYTPVQIPAGVSLNRILDQSARNLYKSAVNKITELVPKTMSKKIAEANVQQAFVFDTLSRYIPHYKNPRILCVGSYEDTASMSLIKMGIKIDEIDPMLNYSLQEYATKPSTVGNSYDIIFSTSVIEHDSNDESFVKCISDLLAPGGLFVMTCDYKEGWRPSDLKPEVDARLYTKEDLKNRLLPLMKGCDLVDVPQWNCPNPDFNYLGKYQYTFATFVVKKQKGSKGESNN